MPEIEPSSVRAQREQELTSITLACRLTPAMKRRADYALVPFDVVPGTARLELEYFYEEQAQIDLGLVDARGAEFPRFPGFRGWSGTARRRVVLTEHAATPGYLPGPIEPGRWWVLLGLYKVQSEGTEVTLRVRALPTPGALPATPPRPTAAPPESPAAEPRWFPGDLHSHTYHSDAPGSLAALVAAARRRGLEFLAVTDHNTTSHLPYLPAQDELTLVGGEEVTTYYGHMNVWGNSAPLDFRVRDAAELRAVIDAAHAQGALVSASHPTLPGMGWSFGYELPLDCVEVWHGAAGPLNSESLAIWERLLAAGRRVIAVGGSDVHIEKPGSPLPGEPTTWIRAGSPAGVLEALRAGRVAIAAHDGPWLELKASDGSRAWNVGDTAPPGPITASCLVERGRGSTVRVLSARRELAAATVDQDRFELELALDLSDERLVRAELKKGNASWQEAFPLLAMTNPIWCR